MGSINNFFKLPTSNIFEEFSWSLYIKEFMFEQVSPGNTLINGIISDSLHDKGQRQEIWEKLFWMYLHLEC